MNRINRRDFVRTASMAGTVLGLGALNAKAAADLPIGLQLYTVRDLMGADFRGTLEKVAGIGYRYFEFAGYGDMDAAGLSAFIKGLGAGPCGAHEGYESFMADPDKAIAFLKGIGCPYVIVPSMPGPVRSGGADAIRKFARGLNQLGEKAKRAGMQLCYHNHSFEFEKIDGRTLWDILFEAADADLVKAEVDVAWVYNAGVDPVAFLEQWGSRVKLLHMKDMDGEKNLAPVGAGVIDLESVVSKARSIGVDWYIVEQDRTRPGKEILDEIALSHRNLTKLLS